MVHVLRETLQSLRASPIFGVYVLVTLAWAGIIGLITFGVIDLGMNHFGSVDHRVHDLTYGLLFTTGIVGVLVQLRRPAENVAGMVMALVPWAGLLLATVLSADAGVILSIERVSVAALTVIVVLVHPAGRTFFRSFNLARVHGPMLALVLVAAVPLVVFASTAIELQATVPDAHGAMGHYGFMAAFSFTVIGVGLLASLRPDGWRLTAWVAGLLPALLGAVSLAYPDVSSSLGLGWALAAIAWGAGFIATAEQAVRTTGPPPPVSPRVPARSAPR